MKLLVVEQNELVSKIYKKIFDEKQYEADFVRNEFECLERCDQNYDYVVLDNSENNQAGSLEQKIRKIKPSQKIFSLGAYINSDEMPELNETKKIIEKPFAILTMVGKLEIERANQDF